MYVSSYKGASLEEVTVASRVETLSPSLPLQPISSKVIEKEREIFNFEHNIF